MRRFSAKETYNFKEPTNRSRPIRERDNIPRAQLHTMLQQADRPTIKTLGKNSQHPPRKERRLEIENKVSDVVVDAAGSCCDA